MRIILSVAMVLGVLIGSASASLAPAVPPFVSSRMIQLTEICGTPVPQDFVRRAWFKEFDTPAYVLDYSHACNVVCGIDGCGIAVFIPRGFGWKKAFDSAVHAYEFAIIDGRTVLRVVLAGVGCKGSSAKGCFRTLRLADNEFR